MGRSEDWKRGDSESRRDSRSRRYRRVARDFEATSRRRGGNNTPAECAKGWTVRDLALGPCFRDGVHSGMGVRQTVLNDLHPRTWAGRQPHKRESYATKTETKTKAWKPQKVGGGGGSYLGKMPSELQFEPPNPKYRQITGVAHMNQKLGLGWAKGHKLGSGGEMPPLSVIGSCRAP